MESHHERFDGRGYANGLVAESISWLARFMAEFQSKAAGWEIAPVIEGRQARFDVSFSFTARCAAATYQRVLIAFHSFLWQDTRRWCLPVRRRRRRPQQHL